MTSLRLIAIAIAGAAFAGPLNAAEQRHADAHEHGHGVLNIATEGSHLLMRLEVPGADIIGFEHSAESDQERRAVTEADAKLRAPLSLFVLPAGAACTVHEAHVAIGADEEHGRESEMHHDEAHHGEEHHGEEIHGEDAHHGEEHEGAAHADAEHSEVHAEYEMECQAVTAIDTIRFAYFDAFPGAESLDVNIVTDHGQNSFEVTRDDPVIRIPGMI